MEFIINYWAILLVALILVLLVILAYLIDKKNRKLKEVENYQVKDEKIIENNVDLNINVEDKKLSSINDGEKLNDIKPQVISEELDYDELDIENIDDEFNKVIPKKRIIDDSIKSSIDSIKIEPLSVSKVEDDDSNIELPNIKL